MSALTFEHKPFTTDWHLPVFFKRVFAAGSARGRQFTELNALQDHLLLDIGIDPRSAPLSLHDAIARPDLTNGGVVTSRGRIAARS